MADLRRSVLGMFQQGVDAVSNAVIHVSNATRNKMDELTLQNQRRELLENLANTVYALWEQGETYPDSLTGILEQLKDVNGQLAAVCKPPEKAADEAVKQEVAEPAQGSEVPEKEDEVVPSIEVQEEVADEEVPTWPEPPVHNDVPQILVQEEQESEE